MYRKSIAAGLMALLLVVLWIGVAAAQTGSGFDLSWHVVGGGGGTSTGSGFSVSGTIGQSAAGIESGSGFTLNSGFWIDLLRNQLYLPLILR